MGLPKRRVRANGNSENHANGRASANGRYPRPVRQNGVKRPARRPVIRMTQPAPEDLGPVPPTKLGADELEQFRRLLLAKRGELVGDVNHMEGEALGKNRSDASGDLSLMPIHMADIGTDNYEQEFTLGLVANERATLKEIDAALKRIEDGTFGVCLATHKPISKARLKAKPWATYCVEYERTLEQGRRR